MIPAQYLLIRAKNGWVIEIVDTNHNTEGYVVCHNLKGALLAIEEVEDEGDDVQVDFEPN